MSTSKIARFGIAVVLVVAAVALVSCKKAGTLPAGQAYLTIQNPNTGTTNSYVYKNVMIDNSVQSPSEITEGTQQNYAVTTSTAHTVQFSYSTPTGSNTIGPFQVNVPSSGCLVVGPSGNNTTYTTGC